MHPRWRELLLNIAAFGAGLIPALFLLEGLTRWFVPDPDLTFENRLAMFAENPQVGYRNRSHYRGWAQGLIELRINALGFRGPEIQPQKSPGTTRILGLGDSVTFGVGVKEPEVFLRRLEREANAAASNARRVEVVNLGVTGYSLHQELVTLQQFGMPLSPDIVLVGFVLNDAYPTEDPFFNVNKLHRPGKKNVHRREYRDPPPAPSYAYRLALNLLRRRQQRRTPDPPPPPLWPPDGYDLQAWPCMQEDFREFRRLASINSFHLGVVLFPKRMQFDAGEQAPAYPQRLIAEFLRLERIPYLDLYDTVRADRRFLLDQMHLSSSGHAAVAEAIGGFIQQQGW